MQLLTKSFFILWAAIVLASCEDVVDFPIEQKQQLVVFSNFSDQNGLEVLLYKTSDVLESGEPDFVSDAVVEVYEGDQLLEVLEFVPSTDGDTPPFFRTKLLKPEVAVLYTIKVSVEGFETITATNSIPTPVPIQSVVFDNTVDENAEADSRINFLVSVTLTDPIDVINFYHLKFYQELIPYVISLSGDTIRGTSSLLSPMAMNPTDENAPIFKYDHDQSYLLDDKWFNGREVTLEFTGGHQFDPKKFIAGNFYVELRTVSEAYFLYYYTLGKQNNGSGPFSSDVKVYNNIQNGVGNFSGFATNINAFKLGG